VPPNFLRLKEDGSFRNLATTNPAQSPVAWASFVTGQDPGKNGIFVFKLRLSFNLKKCLIFANFPYYVFTF